MKYLLVLVVLFIGCNNEVGNIAPYCEDTLVWQDKLWNNNAQIQIGNIPKISFLYDYMWRDEEGTVMYKMHDSVWVIPDTLRALKAAMKQLVFYRDKADSLERMVDSITYKQNYIHQ